MRRKVSHLVCSLLALAGLTAAVPYTVAEPITYQGRLDDAGVPATGSFDMIFRVYSAPTGGDLLATAPMVTVSTLDGLIVAMPDFPAGTFTGATVYLDISLRRAGDLLYRRLGERQQVTPAPLALRSLNERWSPLSASRIRSDVGVTNVLINETTPTFNDAAFMVTSATGALSLGGMYMNTAAADGIPYYGWSANRVSLAEARVEGTTSTFILRGATTEWLRISSDGRVGLGTSATTSERLRIFGNAVVLGQVIADDLVAGDDVIATDTSYANSFAYSTPKSRSLSFPPEAFHAAFPNQVGTFGGGSGVAYLDASVVSGAITTGVHLPQGATVVGLDAYVVDNSAVANLTVNVDRRQLAGLGYQTMVGVATSGSSASPVTLTNNSISFGTIDNDNYCYSVWVYSDDWQGVAMYVKAVRIRYTVAGPD